jgi:spermidine/putrescine-binding protein
VTKEKLTRIERRKLLKGLGAAGMAGLAGCAGGGQDGDTTTAEETTASDSETTDAEGDATTEASGPQHFGVNGPFADSVQGLTWSGWDVPSITGRFQDDTGLSVSTEFIGSDLQGFQQIQSGSDYQFIVPDTVWVQRLAEAGLAQPIDEELFADELEAMPERVRNHRSMFYEDERYGIPPRWGINGLIYNSDYVSEEEVQSWSVLWNDEYQDRYEIFNLPLWGGPKVALYLIEQGEISIDGEVTAEKVYGLPEEDMQTVQDAAAELFSNAQLLAGSANEANRPLINETVYMFDGFLFNYAQLKTVEQDLGTDKFRFMPNPGLGGLFWVEGMTMTSAAESEGQQNTTEAFMKWALSRQGQANLAWTELRKSPPANFDARELLSDNQQEILHLDDLDTIADNSIDYYPSEEEKWTEMWEAARQQAGN